MATEIVCDGCRVVLYTKDNPRPSQGRALAIQGDRIDGAGGNGILPSGQFHWCEHCSIAAFRAVRDAVLQSRGWTK